MKLNTKVKERERETETLWQAKEKALGPSTRDPLHMESANLRSWLGLMFLLGTRP